MIWGYTAILLVYLIVILVLLYGYQKQATFHLRKEAVITKFSIVIPFRNEADNLPALLQSLQQLSYPETHFEVLFVNDHSEDLSEEIIQKQLEDTQIDFKILQNTPNQSAPKKTAITLAIAMAKYDWILTTDADCNVPKAWLNAFNDYCISNQVVCIAAPVTYTSNNSLLERYQQLDNWSLQSVTVASFALQNPLLSNGANFAYKKDVFIAVNGFEGNLHIASGDDLFLLEKIAARFPKQIGYLKSSSAVVTTYPVTSWKALVSQRVRWASKTSAQKELTTKLIGSIVFLAAVAVLLFLLFFYTLYGVRM